MKSSYVLLLILVLLISGCSKIYVCYDGSTQKLASKCPKLPTPELTEQEAGKVMDNFGYAYAQAKGDTYTRVNLYSRNTTWYSGVLFTNKQNQSVKETTFLINGTTGNVKCLTGCEYLNQ